MIRRISIALLFVLTVGACAGSERIAVDAGEDSLTRDQLISLTTSLRNLPEFIEVSANNPSDDLALETITIIDPETGLGNSSLEVFGEGTWVVAEEVGVIGFSRDPTFSGDPSPISYTVQDTDGNEIDVDDIAIPPEQTVSSEDLRQVASGHLVSTAFLEYLDDTEVEIPSDLRGAAQDRVTDQAVAGEIRAIEFDTPEFEAYVEILMAQQLLNRIPMEEGELLEVISEYSADFEVESRLGTWDPSVAAIVAP